MATVSYMSGRRKYFRPQAMLFADNPGSVIDGFHVPDNEEFDNFIILSDDNRSPISFRNTRIEQRERMINGRMRSYHVADKLDISTSWTNLPSRSFSSDPEFNAQGAPDFLTERVEDRDGTSRPVKPFGSPYFPDQQYTTDGGAGGVDLLNWYENNQGSFWVYLAYDKYTNFEENKYQKFAQYNEVVEVFFSDFSHSVTKRGATTHDYWDISLSLEEV
jgi:hypothetical protein